MVAWPVWWMVLRQKRCAYRQKFRKIRRAKCAEWRFFSEIIVIQAEYKQYEWKQPCWHIGKSCIYRKRTGGDPYAWIKRRVYKKGHTRQAHLFCQTVPSRYFWVKVLWRQNGRNQQCLRYSGALCHGKLNVLQAKIENIKKDTEIITQCFFCVFLYKKSDIFLKKTDACFSWRRILETMLSAMEKHKK